MILFIGIDPGKTGAAVLIHPTHGIMQWFDWPGSPVIAANNIRKWMDMHYCDIFKAAIEKVHSMPGQGVSSVFTFGTNYGMWQGILAAFNIPFQSPAPQTWQKGHKTKADGKQAIAVSAINRFPEAASILYGPKGGLKDGRADALMIAYWAMQNHAQTV